MEASWVRRGEKTHIEPVFMALRTVSSVRGMEGYCVSRRVMMSRLVFWTAIVRRVWMVSWDGGGTIVRRLYNLSMSPAGAMVVCEVLIFLGCHRCRLYA